LKYESLNSKIEIIIHIALSLSIIMIVQARIQ